jgi:hypothetical protein
MVINSADLYYGIYFNYFLYFLYFDLTGWLESVGSLIVYVLYHRKPFLYVILKENILRKLPVVP